MGRQNVVFVTLKLYKELLMILKVGIYDSNFLHILQNGINSASRLLWRSFVTRPSLQVIWLTSHFAPTLVLI